MKKSNPKKVGAVTLAVFFAVAVGFAYSLSTPKATLPYYDHVNETSRQHVISDFILTDQRGINITGDSVKEKHWLVSFLQSTK